MSRILGFFAVFAVASIAYIAFSLGGVLPDGVNESAPASTTLAPAENTALLRVDVYSDFVCPYSRDAAPIVRELAAEFDGVINLSFRHFPLKQHPSAWVAAEAAECARDQGKFWEYHDALFNASGDVGNLDVLDELGEAVGLGLDEFDECLDSGAKKQFVLDSKEEGVRRGVKNTPTFFIGGSVIPAALDLASYEGVIKAELAKNNTLG